MTGLKFIILTFLTTVLGVKFEVFDDIKNNFGTYFLSISLGIFSNFLKLPNWILEFEYYNEILDFIIRTGVTIINVIIAVSVSFFTKKLLTKYTNQDDKRNSREVE